MNTLLDQATFINRSQSTCLVKISAAALLVLLTVSAAFAQLSGQVYRDFNGDGIRQQGTSPEPGVSGVLVKAYLGGSATVLSYTTDSTGTYSFAVPDGTKVRLEFSNFPFQSFPGISGADNGSSVQFVTAPATAHLGLLDPLMYSSTQTPDLVVPQHLAGDALASGSNSSGLKALVRFPFAATGQGQVPTNVATAGQTGSVWGGTLQRQSGQLLHAAFLKRHSGLGPLGLGGLYKTSLSGTTTPYLDLSTFVTLSSPEDGQLLQNRLLPADYTLPSVDTTAFRLVGKVGLGGMAFSPDEKELYVVNLYQKTLVKINVGVPARPADEISSADVTSFQLPATGCTLGQVRPWALTYHQGALYVGVTCDGSTDGASRSDLKAFVYRFDLSTHLFDPTPVLSTPLDYRKGWVHAGVPQSEYWESWTDRWSDLTTSTLAIDGTDTTFRVSRPQPLLSSIQFDKDGSMILGLMDRTGHQTGRLQASLTASSNRYSGYVGGDLLRAQYRAATNGYFMESNGQSGDRTGEGVGNNQGPGGGEFYARDNYLNQNGDPIQEETSMGALLVVPGSEEVLAAVIEPFTTWSGGIGWFSNQDGSRSKAYEVYNSNPAEEGQPIQLQYFGNANGLGAPVAISQAATLQIGNRLWLDQDRDGVQDPDEKPLANVAVALYDTTGSLYAITQTDAAGKYAFQSPTLQPFTTYYVVIGYNGSTMQFNKNTNMLTLAGVEYGLTKPDSGEGDNPDLNDSDARLGTTLPEEINGYPYFWVQTGAAGQNNPNYDAGFVPCDIEAGEDQIVCAGTVQVQLNEPAEGQVWRALETNPAAVTVDKYGLVNGLSTSGDYYFVLEETGSFCRDTVKVTVKPELTVQAVAIAGTCTAGVQDDNGKIQLTGFTPGSTFQISLGSSFGDPLSPTAQVVPEDGVIIATLPNPTDEPQAYKVWVVDPSGCSVDLVVTFQPVECPTCTQPAKICLPVKARVLSSR
jgi:hypothetical protein